MAEGKLAVLAVLASPYPLVSVLVLRRRLAVVDELALPPSVPVYVVDDGVMSTVAGFDVHRGRAGPGRPPGPSRAASLLATAGKSPVVVVEGVNDQENLGAIFRNAAAFGAAAVLVDPTCADPLYRRTVRVSLGLVLRVPFTRLSPWPASLALVAEEWVHPAGAHAPGGRRQPGRRRRGAAGRKGRRRRRRRGPGLERRRARDVPPGRIPMAPGIDSLNVAAATAVALHRLTALH